MAKLNKRLDDYFQLSILLKPVGQTSFDLVKKYESIMNQTFSNFQLEQEQCKVVQNATKDVIRNQTSIRTYKLHFSSKDYNNDWPEFQTIYKYHICIGLYDAKDNDIDKLTDNLNKINRQMIDDRRKLVALFIINAGNVHREKYITGAQIEKSMLFVPNVSDQDICTFLEPSIHTIIRDTVLYLADEIRKLKSEQNDFIVFNKNEERPEPKTIKKKKRGRCLKLAADLTLMLLAQQDALPIYKQSLDLLKKCDDYLWMMGAQLGRAACIYFKYTQNPAVYLDEDLMRELTEQITDRMIDSIVHIRKAKMPTFESECYFRAFKVIQQLKEKSILDDWIIQYTNQAMKNYVVDDQFIFLCEIANIYQQLQMLRKRNFYLCVAAELYIEKKPEISRMLYKYIKENSTDIKQWKVLYLKLLKTLIKSDTTDQFKGIVQCELLDTCCDKLTKEQINEIIQKLNYNSFQIINSKLSFLTLERLTIEQSNRRPKPNKLNIVERPTGVIAPWRKSNQMKFHEGESIRIKGSFYNPLSLPVSIRFSLKVVPELDAKYYYVYLQELKSNEFDVQMVIQKGVGSYKLVGLKVSIWNFMIDINLPRQILFEIYERTANYNLVVPKQYDLEKSSEAVTEFSIVNLYQIGCAKMKVNISVYYSVEIGLQENVFMVEDANLLDGQTITVRCRQSKDKKCIVTYHDNVINVSLDEFRMHRQYLKKFEINIDYITHLDSKYQLSSMVTVPIVLKQSLKCNISEIKHQIQPLTKQFRNKHIIESQFKVVVTISKQPYDLKAYKVTLTTMQTQPKVVMVSEQTTVQVEIIVSKIRKNSQNLQEYLQKLVKVHWECITLTALTGQMYCEVSQQVQYDLIERSDKIINTNFHINGQKISKSNLSSITLMKQDILFLSYQVVCQGNIDHTIMLESIGVRQTRPGYAIQGKTCVKAMNKASNQVWIEMEANYSNEYLIVLNFGHQVYLDRKVIKCVEN